MSRVPPPPPGQRKVPPPPNRTPPPSAPPSIKKQKDEAATTIPKQEQPIVKPPPVPSVAPRANPIPNRPARKNVDSEVISFSSDSMAPVKNIEQSKPQIIPKIQQHGPRITKQVATAGTRQQTQNSDNSQIFKNKQLRQMQQKLNQMASFRLDLDDDDDDADSPSSQNAQIVQGNVYLADQNQDIQIISQVHAAVPGVQGGKNPQTQNMAVQETFQQIPRDPQLLGIQKPQEPAAEIISLEGSALQIQSDTRVDASAIHKTRSKIPPPAPPGSKTRPVIPRPPGKVSVQNPPISAKPTASLQQPKMDKIDYSAVVTAQNANPFLEGAQIIYPTEKAGEEFIIPPNKPQKNFMQTLQVTPKYDQEVCLVSNPESIDKIQLPDYTSIEQTLNFLKSRYQSVQVDWSRELQDYRVQESEYQQIISDYRAQIEAVDSRIRQLMMSE